MPRRPGRPHRTCARMASGGSRTTPHAILHDRRLTRSCHYPSGRFADAWTWPPSPAAGRRRVGATRLFLARSRTDADAPPRDMGARGSPWPRRPCSRSLMKAIGSRYALAQSAMRRSSYQRQSAASRARERLWTGLIASDSRPRQTADTLPTQAADPPRGLRGRCNN